MINIIFIVPYPEMEKTVKKIFNTHPKKDMLYQNISVVSAENINVNQLDGDILIARGLTYQKIKEKKPLMPKIELTIRALDIINTLIKCTKKYNPKKIALIGNYSAIEDAKPFFDVISCPVKIFNQKSIETLAETFDLALKSGFDTFVGGFSVSQYAKKRKSNYMIIETGEESIRNTLNEAIRTYEILKNNQIAKTIIEHSKEGILNVGRDYKVSLMNPQAQNYFDKLHPGKQYYQKNIKDVFPFMTENIKKVFSEKKEIANELHKIGDDRIAATYMPIFIGDEITGVVINMASVEKVQHDEIQIRKKLSEKGLNAKYTFSDIIYSGNLMAETIRQANKIALAPSNVLLIGETGTGKELFAQSIHNASSRKNGPFVAINCAALPENLLESELFGYAEGAFSGASKGGKIGLFELAHNGTLFLDEISEIPISFQSKLLRVLQEHEIRRIGDNRVISIDVRIISACNKNIYDLADKGLFRKDLIYRLDVLKLYIPSLRSRPEDIKELFIYYIDKCSKKIGNHINLIKPEALQLLKDYEFEGNVRELKNIAERICVFITSDTVDFNQMHDALCNRNIDGECKIETDSEKLNERTYRDERKIIEETLEKYKFNRKKAAENLGIDRSTLWRKMKKYNIN